MSREDGGNAFPVHHNINADTLPGMSLRDYFAANAPITLSDLQKYLGEIDPETAECLKFQDLVELLAAFRYIHADAMLETRKEGGDE